MSAFIAFVDLIAYFGDRFARLDAGEDWRSSEARRPPQSLRPRTLIYDSERRGFRGNKTGAHVGLAERGKASTCTRTIQSESVVSIGTVI